MEKLQLKLLNHYNNVRNYKSIKSYIIMKNTGLHDILDELRDKESLHVEIGWHPNGYAYSIYRINRRDTEPCYASSERYHNYRECLGAAIVKAMNLAD